MPNLVIVSNRLPVSVKKVDGKLEFSPSTGGIATGLSAYTKRRGTKWIGWPGIPSDELTEADRAQITRELKKDRCYPVFLSQKQLNDFYLKYSNGLLWPLMHDLPLGKYTASSWTIYRQVNSLFAEEVIRLSKPSDAVWIHDYLLTLAPRLVRQMGHTGKIGFFFHIPFPKLKVLTQSAEAKSLLKGMLGADLIGFHTRSYAKNFLLACDELLGTLSQHGTILLNDRTISVVEFPMGIDYGRFAKATRLRVNRLAARKLRRKYPKQKIIVSVDRLDPTKGLVGRLKAYQSLLRQNPQLLGKVILVMIVAPSRTDVPAYQAVKTEIDKILLAIDKEFSRPKWQPVDFIYEVVPLDTVMSYYQMADVAFIAPMIDGMNLVAKEFVASRRYNNGVLVLSETAGAAEELRDAIQVNPNRPETMVAGLKQALELPKHELRRRIRDMKHLVEHNSVQHWAESFVDTLQRPHSLTSKYAKTIGDQQTLDISSSYRHATKRLILLDYDGVLRRFKADPAAASPTEQIMKLLADLSNDPKNEVVMISGRSKAELGEWFGTLPVALAAEHGALFRRKGGKNWHSTSGSGKFWKNEVRALFEHYAKLTPGALVDKKEWSLAWHYRAANPYHAQKNLVALRSLLKPIAKQYGLSIEEGHKVLEVRPFDINKGKVTREWLIHDHDFIVAVGDDTTDEDMFAALPPGAYSIKVGRGNTYARYRVKDVQAVLGLLGKLR